MCICLYIHKSLVDKEGGEVMVDLFKALADETRLRILAVIMKEPSCVCEVEACLELTQSNVSRHLNTLKRAGILESYKISQWTYYKVSEAFVTNHRELYDYVMKEIQKTSFYENDCTQIKACKKMGLCNDDN